MNLQQLGWNAHFQSVLESSGLRPILEEKQNGAIGATNEGRRDERVPAAALHENCVGRVAREDREAYVVYGAGRAWRASVSGGFRHRARARADFPAVGDWVIVQPRRGEAKAVIQALLPRRTAVSRKQAGEVVDAQVIAANVDILLLCMGLDGDFNVRRIERYLTLAYQSGARPVVLLTKSDACADVARAVDEVRAAAMGVDVWSVSIHEPATIAPVRDLLSEGTTAALIGSSGVGKSSLINAVFGGEVMATGGVRESDSRGRHTTTHRQLLLVPGGGVIIDTPGMREIQLWGEESGLDSSFSDIETLAERCRFRDCGHVSEPGCAVQAALESGELDGGRYRSYRKQQGELRRLAALDDPLLRIEERAKWKEIHKSARKWMKKKYGDYE